MTNGYMLKAGLLLCCALIFVSASAFAGTYTLLDGSKIEGEPISLNDNGIVFHASDGTDLPRIAYEKFTQDSIRALLQEVKTPRDRSMLQPYLDDDEPPKDKAERREIIVKAVETPPRPTGSLGVMAIFGSPVGLFVLFVIYCANLFAAYEVATYRSQPVSTVCGLAAIPFFGVLSPIIFLAMPSRQLVDFPEMELQTRFKATPPPADVPENAPTAAPPPPPEAPRKPAAYDHPAGPMARDLMPVLPEPIVFRRGEFSFNKRFFETKLAAFLKMVPGEADKDLVVNVISARGDLIGRRITRVTANELYLQVFKGDVTADEMIPFTEVLEVRILHKDLL